VRAAYRYNNNYSRWGTEKKEKNIGLNRNTPRTATAAPTLRIDTENDMFFFFRYGNVAATKCEKKNRFSVPPCV